MVISSGILDFFLFTVKTQRLMFWCTWTVLISFQIILMTNYFNDKASLYSYVILVISGQHQPSWLRCPVNLVHLCADLLWYLIPPIPFLTKDLLKYCIIYPRIVSIPISKHIVHSLNAHLSLKLGLCFHLFGMLFAVLIMCVWYRNLFRIQQ